MKILCRTTIALCGFLVIAFLTAGTTAATDTNLADFTTSTNLLTIYVTPYSNDVQEYWSWDFGPGCECDDGGSSPIYSRTFTYSTPGTYNVTLHVKNQGGDYSVTK